MARDAKGRFLPGKDWEGHVLTIPERRKGYEMMLRRPMSSRLRCSIRKKITRYYQQKGRAS